MLACWWRCRVLLQGAVSGAAVRVVCALWRWLQVPLHGSAVRAMCGFWSCVNQVMIGAMHFGMRFWDAFSWAGQICIFPLVKCMFFACWPAQENTSRKCTVFFGWEMRKSNTQNQVTAKIADGPQVLVWAGGSCYPRALGSHIINHIQALFLAYLIPWVSVLMAPFGAYKMVCTWYRHCLRFTSWYVFGIGMRSMI